MFNQHPAAAFFDTIIKPPKAKAKPVLDAVDPGADTLNDELAGTIGAVTEDQNKDKVPGIMDDADPDNKGDGKGDDKDGKGENEDGKGDDKDKDGKPFGTQSAVDAVGDEDDEAADYADADIDLQVAAALHQFAETDADELDDGESLADRLQALLVGVVDPDFNGDIDGDESDMIAVAMESAGDYLAAKGVAEEDIDALLNGGDADAADRVQELLAGKLPSDADGIADDIDDHAFGDDPAPEDVPLLDATMVTAIRNGKKVRIKKRLSGRVRLSAKQKLAIRKMQKKSHSARAQMRRLKSDKVRARLFGKK